MNKLLVFILLFTSCASHHTSSQKPTQTKAGDEENYFITLPAGWTRVKGEEEIKKRVPWSFVNYNFSVWGEEPEIRAWDGPEGTDGFLTILAFRRDRTLGVGTWYEDILGFLREWGAEIQEQGVTTIDGNRCKWWIHAFNDGAIMQQCFMVAHGPQLYVIQFTTPYITEEKMNLYKQIVQSIRFC